MRVGYVLFKETEFGKLKEFCFGTKIRRLQKVLAAPVVLCLAYHFKYIKTSFLCLMLSRHLNLCFFLNDFIKSRNSKNYLIYELKIPTYVYVSVIRCRKKVVSIKPRKKRNYVFNQTHYYSIASELLKNNCIYKALFFKILF